MYRFLLSRRWLLLTAVALALIPVMARLGLWQLHRHEQRVANNRLIAANLAAKPVPVTELTSPGATVSKALTGRAVVVSGHYDARHEVVARQRTSADGSVGYYVITPLVIDGGSPPAFGQGARSGQRRVGAAVLVNRGWVAPGDNVTSYPAVPPAPSGEVTITGRLRPDETTASTGIRNRAGLPDRQVYLISSRQQAAHLAEPVLGGYLELVTTTPRPGSRQPAVVPAPSHDDIGPHLAYAIQWWLFTAMVPVGWVLLVRRERRDRAELVPAATRPGELGADPHPS